jgi:hypothetical protein
VLLITERNHMKMAFIVHNEYFTPRVMQLLKDGGIDYYTRWERAQGKGRGTEPHLGTGSFASTNAVLMIAFQDDSTLEGLIRRITETNHDITRADDRIRLFQVPLDRIV